MDLSMLDPLVPHQTKQGPRILYGTVVTSVPLTVLVDGDTAATAVTGGVVALAGQRVVMVLQDRVLTALAVVESDTGWLTTGHVVASGWSVTNMRYRRIGKIVSVYFSFTRTGADLIASLNGNLTNTLILTMPEGFRPSDAQALASGSAGFMCAGYVDTGGTVNISAVTYDQDVTTATAALSLGGTYFVD